MKEVLITALVEETMKEVVKFGYCQKSCKIFEYHLKNLLKYYKQKGIQNYSYDVSVNFLVDMWNIDINKGHFNYWESRKCRTIKMLDDVYNGRNIKIKYSYTEPILSEQNKKILDAYIDYNTKIGLSNKNIKGIKEFIRRFLKYLEKNNIDVPNLNNLIINKYLFSMNKINKITLKNYIFMLRMFLRYLYDKNVISEKLENKLPSLKRPKNSSLPSVWNFSELNQVLNSIDKTSKKGKRDYAIIMLAITTALRGCDIVNLKLNDIDFENNIITIIQEKTKREIVIPLMDKTKIALVDYIANARPKNTDYQYVFLSCRSTIKPIMNTSALSSMLKKYSDKINLNKKQKRGIHSLRHTTLNYLFNDNETSLTTITEISGHYNADSLNAYIKTDKKRLSEFTLSLKDFGGDITNE